MLASWLCAVLREIPRVAAASGMPCPLKRSSARRAAMAAVCRASGFHRRAHVFP